MGGGRQREQHVPFSKEVESRGEIVGYITGRRRLINLHLNMHVSLSTCLSFEM